MKIIIPLAGFGKRMRPHTYSKPKPLVSVAGKPVLGHVLDAFAKLQVDEVVFIVGYLGEQISAYVSAAYPHLQARYIEQKELLGQAHALWLAKEQMQGPTVVVFVDTITEVDLSFLEQLAPTVDGVIFTKEVEDPRRFGIVVADKNNQATKLVEKPDSMADHQALIGLYYFREGINLVSAIEEMFAKEVRTKGEYYLADAVQIMINRGAKFLVQSVDVWEDCGKIDAILHTNRYLLSHGRNNDAEFHRPDVVIVPPAYVAPTANLEAVIVGPYASIGDDVVMRQAIVQDSIIEAGATIENIVLQSSLIGKRAYVRGQRRSLNVGDDAVMSYIDGGGKPA